MYTILMRDDKTLVATSKAQIFQRETMIDNLQFLLPQEYDGKDLSDATVVLKYYDPANIAHMEILTKDEDLYKDKYLRYVLPIDTKITKYAGDVVLHLTVVRMSAEGDLHEEILHTYDITLTVSPMRDLFEYVGDELLEKIDQKIVDMAAKIKAVHKIAATIDQQIDALDKQIEELNQVAEEICTGKGDDLIVEGSKLKLSADGEAIGEGVDIPIEAED